ncbi:hypothetical protein QBC45DRAFT_397718 [Copromyces sp. CBS 386.78]|nr:hypothetical protein QBC45DRAFT_397718 [Copromyces sp. CBS 386.78]
MSQTTDARRKPAEEWAAMLLATVNDHDQESITEVLQDLSEESAKRIAPVWNSNSHSIAWRSYFVAALKRVLRELPPADRSIKELSNDIAVLNASAANANTSTASKPVDTPSTDTPITGTSATFKVDTQGDYKARIVEDCTTKVFEFTLNGPATVVVQTAATGTAAARTAAQLGTLSLWKE